jgi:uncharacterized protein with FMN-binding domain
MRFSRFACGVSLCALSFAVVVALLSCAVNKADLARRVDLRNVDLKLVPDGVYEGSYTIQPPPMVANKTVHVRVTVATGKFTTIEVLDPPKVGQSAAIRTLISRVQESQDLSMDAVSSATMTSTAVLKAIQNAVSPGVN